MQLFHYHLVTSQLRDVEARYLTKLGFDLVARYGRVGDDHVAVEAGTSWRRTFVATNAGYRLEIHPPRDWIEELLGDRAEFRLAELQLRADEPEAKAGALADILAVEIDGTAVLVGDTAVTFLAGGPEGRPELYGERFA